MKPELRTAEVPSAIFGSQGTVTYECYQGTCDTIWFDPVQHKLSSEWNVHERAILSLGAMRNGSAILFRRRVNSCEHNSCLPKCDKLQMFSWLWDDRQVVKF